MHSWPHLRPLMLAAPLCLVVAAAAQAPAPAAPPPASPAGVGTPGSATPGPAAADSDPAAATGALQTARTAPEEPAALPTGEAAPGDATAPEESPAAPDAEGPGAAPATGEPPTAQPKAPAPAARLTVATWGGAYGRSQELAYFAPFSEATGHAVDVVNLKSAEFDTFKAALAGAEPPWDVVDLDAGLLARACAEGLLEPVGPTLASIAAGAAPEDDFLPGALQECGVASVAWSAVTIVNKNAFKKQAPATLQEAFDTKRFPGKRGLPKQARYTLELALMADGVAPGEVYRSLASEEGVARAFAVLDRIRGDIVWWDSGREPIALLSKGELAVALAFSGRTFNAIVRDGLPLALIWEGQIYDLDLWAVPKSSPNKDLARRFIAFATEPERLAAQTRWFPYGPMRRKAVELVDRHAEADVRLLPFLPTAPDNLERGLRLDHRWWAEHGEELNARFAAWLAGTPASDAAPAGSGGDPE